MKSLTPRLLAIAFVVQLTLNPGAAAEQPTSLGKRGAVLLDEAFDGGKVPPGWTANTGDLSTANGTLLAAERSADNHIGAFRKKVDLQDCAIQIRFKLNGARRLDLGFDPAPGELKKKGHLFSVTITPDGWNITEHNDKANPKARAKTHAEEKRTFPADQWHSLLLEVKGEQVRASLDGGGVLTASAADFKVKKPGLVFRMGTKDGAPLAIDEVKVWELK